jgi:hypothetical protein
VIAVLATVAFLLLFGLAVRAVFQAEPTRQLARRWLEETAAGYGAELEIGDFRWGLLPPSVRLRQVHFSGAGVDAEVEAIQIDLGRIWLTQRTVELGRVVANGVRLSLTGLPRGAGGRQPQLKVRVRQLSLEDLEFEGVDLPGKVTLDLDGVRSSWSTQGEESRGFAEVASARLNIGRMEPVDFSLLARFVIDETGIGFSNYRLEIVSRVPASSFRDTAESAAGTHGSMFAGRSTSAGSTVSSALTVCSTAPPTSRSFSTLGSLR